MSHPRLFVSYSRKDQVFAERLAADLIAAGLEIWLDKLHILPGANWGESIQQGLDSAQQMLLIVTENSMNSKNVALEWQYYFDNDKPILPLLLKPAKLSFQLNRLQYIDFANQPYDTALRQLLQRLGVNHFTAREDTKTLAQTREIIKPAIAQPKTEIIAANKTDEIIETDTGSTYHPRDDHNPLHKRDL